MTGLAHPRATGLAALVPSNAVVETLKAFLPLLAKDVAGHVRKLVDAAADARGLLDELHGLDDRVAESLHVKFGKHRAEIAKADADAEAATNDARPAMTRARKLCSNVKAVAAAEAALKEKEAKFRKKISAFESAA